MKITKKMNALNKLIKEQEDYEYILDDYRRGYKVIFDMDKITNGGEFKEVKLKLKNTNRPWDCVTDVEKEMIKHVRKEDELLIYTFEPYFDAARQFIDVYVYYKYIKIEGYDEWFEFFAYCRNGGEFNQIYVYDMYLNSEDNDIPYSLWCEIYRDEIESVSSFTI